MVAALATVDAAVATVSVASPNAAGQLAVLRGTHFERLGLAGAALACQYCASFGDGQGLEVAVL